MKIAPWIFLLFLITQACSMSKDEGENVTTGEGGSLARFTIVDDYLYVVNETSLQTYSLVNNPLVPENVDNEYLGFGTETIFPYENYLLLGTQDGMYIYNLSNPAMPSQVTQFQHIRSCDPIVAENGYAYITLSSSNQVCWRGLNEMQIVNIQNPGNPYLMTNYSMFNPQGLDIHNDSLFVCDDGIKILDVSNKQIPKEIKHISNITAKDVIYSQGRLMVIGEDGFRQYSIQSSGLNLLSTISVTP